MKNVNTRNICVCLVNAIILSIIFRFECVQAQTILYNETWTDNQHWSWRADIKKPILSITSDGSISIKSANLENEYRTGYPSLPCFTKIINAPAGNITFQTNGSHPVTVPLSGKPETANDISIPDGLVTEESRDNSKTFPIYPQQIVQIVYLGSIDNKPLTAIKIYPYQIIDNGQQLRYFEQLTVSISIKKDSKILEKTIKQTSNLDKAIGIQGPVREFKSDRTLSKPNRQFSQDQNLIRIVVDTDGIYRISRATLIDSGAAVKNIDPRTFQLFNQGSEIPLFVSGESDGSFNKSDYIEFYGQRNRNSVADYYFDPFTDNNVYFLTWGQTNGLRYAEESAKATISDDEAIIPTDYEYTEHFEENNHFENLGKVDVDLPTHTRDHWFFDSGINGGTTKSYFFNLTHPNQNTIENYSVNVGMHGLTYQDGSHRVTVYINDYYAATDSWSDQVPHVIKSEAAQTLQNRYLIHGKNKIQIAVAGDDPTNRYDKVLFDYIDLRYKRLYIADNEQIEFTKPETGLPGTYHFRISGFNDPDISVYKVGKSKLMDFSVEYSTLTKNYSILIEDEIGNQNDQYFAASRSGTLQPVIIQPDTIFNIIQEPGKTDLIIIASEEFKYKLNRLTSFYEDIEITPFVVGIKDVYNEFNNGIVSPYAIRNFLEYVKENWQHKPNAVLLIGDSEIREQKSVPAFFNQSFKYGACASDQWYVVFDEKSGIPEYTIGRWPVSSREELELMIDKRINYVTKAPVDQWHNELLYIAGYEDAFKNQTENMIQRQIPKEFSINRIFINPSSVKTPFFGGSDTLLYLWNQGLALINFMGHGGGAVWSDRSLFNTTHIEYLDNYDKLPFITSLTCFTADFAHMTGLGEHLVLAENGGAIGLWGATSVGWIKNDYLMAKFFYDVIFEPGMTVGEAIQYSKIKYLADQYFDYLKYSMVNSYNLIGDPTVVIPFPEQRTSLSIDKSNPQKGETIQLSGTFPFEDGELYTQLYDSATYRVFSEPLMSSIENGSVQQSITLPLSINPGNTFLNYYFRDSEAGTDGNGVTLISIKGLNFYNFSVQPEQPDKGENFTISVWTELTNIDTMICEMDTSNAYEYLDENGIEHINSFNNPSSIIRFKMTIDDQQSNQWYLDNPVKIGTAGKLIGVRFVAVDAARNQTTGSNFSFRIKRDPDLSVRGISQGGTAFPQITVSVNNASDDTLNTKIDVYSLHDQTETLFNSGQFKVSPNRLTECPVPGILGTGQQTFKVVVDPDNTIRESNENNNTFTDSLIVNTYPLISSLGSSTNGVQNDSIKIDDYTVFIASGSIADSSALIVQTKEISPNPNQPQFSLISQPGNSQYQSIEVALPNLSDSLQKPLFLEFKDQDTVYQNVSIARWDNYLKIWILSPTTYQPHSYSTHSAYPGQFTLVRCQDTEPPHLELSLDGQQFFQNSYVSRKPNISIITEDKNGVNFNKSGLRVFLDGNPVNFDELNIPDTLANGNYISAQFRPEMEYGEHDIEVIVKDAAGNCSSNRISFTVSDELKLIDYGNYPNPFKDRTVFIYELTQRVDDFKIKIYTSSGRLIKILEESSVFSTGLDMTEGGYHEILWNGLDEDGNFIANGVYFYKMIAKSDSKTVSKIGKLAKAR